MKNFSMGFNTLRAKRGNILVDQVFQRFVSVKILRCMLVVVLVFSSAFCSFGGNFAVADYSILAGFHPKMARFDFSIGRFFLPNVNLGDSKQVTGLQKLVKQKSSENAPKIETLRREKNRIIREISNFEVSSKTTVNSMLKEGKNPSQIQESLAKKKSELNGQLAGIDEQILNIGEAALDVIYFSREKSRTMLGEIFSEVDKVLQEISAEKGGVVIIDKSFILTANSMEKAPPPVEGLDPDCVNLYKALMDSEYSVAPDLLNGPPGHKERLLKGIESRFRGTFEKSLVNIPVVRSLVSNYHGRLLLAGGENLTPLALSRILKNNNVNEEFTKKIVELVSQL
ncbi:MAG: hypothetical protein HQM08_11615 [Candidatus Riflebacteria bacterium]|nr:hypothetical protein [Candidatus Riflebacteria bacterium]